MRAFLGLGGGQWMALLTAALTAAVLADALAGHLRSGFVLRVQYAPFAVGGPVVAMGVVAAVWPKAAWVPPLLRLAGALAVAAGVVGAGYHHVYGIARRPGGYRWLLHNLMHGAPPLAPLALAAAGALALLAGETLSGAGIVAGMPLRNAFVVVSAIALQGLILQATLLHYRGAFHNPLMFAPLTAPQLAVPALAWVVADATAEPLVVARTLLWTTFVTGFAGLGMHLRGFERQMGGLHLALFNWLEGPPALAPALMAGFAAVALAALALL
jgi:hypothetical protein